MDVCFNFASSSLLLLGIYTSIVNATVSSWRHGWCLEGNHTLLLLCVVSVRFPYRADAFFSFLHVHFLPPTCHFSFCASFSFAKFFLPIIEFALHPNTPNIMWFELTSYIVSQKKNYNKNKFEKPKLLRRAVRQCKFQVH